MRTNKESEDKVFSESSVHFDISTIDVLTPDAGLLATLHPSFKILILPFPKRR